MAGKSFQFTGGVGGFWGTALVAWLIVVFTLGIALPFATVYFMRWFARHTFVEGRRLEFVGSGMGLFGQWIKWFLLIIVTVGIYGFWVYPRYARWVIENLDFDQSAPRPEGLTQQQDVLPQQ